MATVRVRDRDKGVKIAWVQEVYGIIFSNSDLTISLILTLTLDVFNMGPRKLHTGP